MRAVVSSLAPRSHAIARVVCRSAHAMTTMTTALTLTSTRGAIGATSTGAAASIRARGCVGRGPAAPRRWLARGSRAGDGDGGEGAGEGDGEGSDDGGGVATKRSYRPGALNRLPNVSPGEQLIASAVKRASRVTPNRGLKEAARERSKGQKQLDALTAGLCAPLKGYVKGFPSPERLHPFERALLELTLSDKKYRTTIEQVDTLRKGLLGVGKGFSAQVTKTTGIKDAEAVREQGFKEVEAFYRRSSRHVDDLKSIAQLLRRLPVAELETPTVALVGAPNVGKSSLVRVLSSGQPEVCNYPFTTKGIKMGHFFIDDERHIVTDTPGLLARDDIDRNKIEMLTIATLEHLPTCVIFVTDLSGLSGTSIDDQLQLREEIYKKFAHRRPWIDVFSKCALVPVLGGTHATDMETLWGEEEIAEANRAIAAIPKAMSTSADEQLGIAELKDALATLLGEHKQSLPASRDDYTREKDDRPEYIHML